MVNELLTGLRYFIEFFFEFLSFIFIFRFCLKLVDTDYYDPLWQLTNKITGPVVNPFMRFIPSYRHIESVTLLLLFLISLLKVSLTEFLLTDAVPLPYGLLIWGLMDLANLFLDFIFFAVLINAIVSWLSISRFHPAFEFVERLTFPIIAPVRRLIPSISGYDFSPLIVLILLKLIQIFVIQPIMNYGIDRTF